MFGKDKESTYSIIIVVFAVLVLAAWIIAISPLATSFSVQTHNNIHTILLAISAIGTIVAIANIVLAYVHKNKLLLAVIGLVLFLINLLMPAILFFVGMMAGGAG